MLKHIWDRVVRRRKTVEETASAFQSQFPVVKLILFKWLAVEFGKCDLRSPVPEVPDEEAAVVYAAQVMNFLTGDFDPTAPRASDGVRKFVHIIRDDVEEAAHLVMQDDRIRGVIVSTLRMRLILAEIQDADFRKTPTGRQISLLLLRYGAEFQESVNENRYAAMVSDLIAWAESPQYEGRDFRLKPKTSGHFENQDS